MERLVAASSFNMATGPPCYLLALPQEIKDHIFGYVVDDAVGHKPFLWLTRAHHNRERSAGIPFPVKLGYCTKYLMGCIIKIVIERYPIAVPLSIDTYYQHEFERVIGYEAEHAIIEDIRKFVFVVYGAEFMSASSLASWALLSCDGALAGVGDDAISYDMSESWYDKSMCVRAHAAEVERMLRRAREMGQRVKVAIAQEMPNASKTEKKQKARADIEAGVRRWLYKGYRLPSTLCCGGCEYTGVRFLHDDPDDDYWL